MACHVRIASATAKFGQPEVNLGLDSRRRRHAAPAAARRSRSRAVDDPRRRGDRRRPKPQSIGLVNEVHPADDLAEAVIAFLATLRSKSPIALARALEASIAGGECAQGEGMRLEAGQFGLCFATEDMREGTTRFRRKKRRPRFSGR